MAEPAVVISNDDIARDLHHAAEADKKAGEEAAKAQRAVRNGWLLLAFTAAVAVILYRVTLGHLGTLLCVFAAVVCFGAAIVSAGRAVERPGGKPLMPPWVALALREVRTGDAVYAALADDTKHFTSAGAQAKARDAAAALAGKETAVTRAHAFLVLGCIVVGGGFASIALSSALGLVAIIVIVIAALYFAT